MAGGGGSLGGGSKVKRGSNSKRKAKKRAGFHIDMTPLVDITFLLLTFFMFTTTYAQPQVMEMSVPPEQKSDVEVRESELMQFFINNDAEIWFGLGNEDPEQISLSDVKPIAERENLKEGKINRMITALKVADKAPYGLVINMLDELNLAEVTIIQEISQKVDPETGEPYERQRRFTIADISDEELAKVSDEIPMEEATE